MPVSPLASVFVWSPNHYNGRSHDIDKITIHHMAGNLSAQRCGEVFESTSRQASSNYGVDSDGVIGCYVDEANAAWTSSSYSNDNRAVTIEVADYDLDEWSPSDAAYDATIDLVVDICQRNGIDQLVYTGGPDGTMTEHMMFSSTACPGPWWHARMAQVTEEINARLRGENPKRKDDEVKDIGNYTGDIIRLYNDASGDHHYATPGEADSLIGHGWKKEGVAFTIKPDGKKPVFRMFNPNTGDHLPTISKEEAQNLQDNGWVWEGVEYFAKESGKPVYRLYNPNGADHLLTTDASEKDKDMSLGWKFEGVAFCV